MARSASCSRARVDERAELVYSTINLGEDERRVGKREVVRESDGGRVATPAPVLRSRAGPGSDRIEDNIGIGAEKVGTVLHPPAAKALADEMSLAAVSCVEVPAVLTIQVLHPCRQRVVRHFEGFLAGERLDKTPFATPLVRTCPVAATGLVRFDRVCSVVRARLRD